MYLGGAQNRRFTTELLGPYSLRAFSTLVFYMFLMKFEFGHAKSADPSLVERARVAEHSSICISHGDRWNSYDPTSFELIMIPSFSGSVA